MSDACPKVALLRRGRAYRPLPAPRCEPNPVLANPITPRPPPQEKKKQSQIANCTSDHARKCGFSGLASWLELPYPRLRRCDQGPPLIPRPDSAYRRSNSARFALERRHCRRSVGGPRAPSRSPLLFEVMVWVPTSPLSIPHPSHCPSSLSRSGRDWCPRPHGLTTTVSATVWLPKPLPFALIEACSIDGVWRGIESAGGAQGG